jgi:tetratricopeptide (TPR) repeat protein
MSQRLSWYIWILLAASNAYSLMGRWEEAVEEVQKGLRVGEEFSDNSLISLAAIWILLAYNYKGDLARALEYGELVVSESPNARR